MSNVTGTYNGISLGEYLSPLTDNASFLADFSWNNSTNPLFERKDMKLRADGAELNVFTLRFSKCVLDDATLVDDIKFLEWIDNFKSTIYPTIGSTTGATLELTNGTNTWSKTGVFIDRVQIARKQKGIMEIVGHFRWSEA